MDKQFKRNKYSEQIQEQRAEKNESAKQIFTFRIGNIHKSHATMIDLDYNFVQFPLYLLPKDSKPGSVIKMQIQKDDKEQQRRDEDVDKICNKVINGLQGSNTSNTILSEQ